MKHIKISMLGLVACMMLFCGCGQQKETQVDYAGAIQTIMESTAITDSLDELDTDTAWALYGFADAGLDREQLTNSVIYRSAGGSCEELAYLEFDSAEAAKTAQEALKTYLQNQIEENQDYRPQEIPKLEGAVLQQSDAQVFLAVTTDSEQVEAALQAK